MIVLQYCPEIEGEILILLLLTACYTYRCYKSYFDSMLKLWMGWFYQHFVDNIWFFESLTYNFRVRVLA